MSSNQERKLAAILFADVVGYTSLMQGNETLALQKINRYQTLLDSAAQQFNGQVLKSYGDGSLMTFRNSLDAVKAAKQIQEQAKLELPVPLRIGIHVGEFIVKKGDIYGNGVNIAARIESLGITGAVLFSKNIYQKIKNKPEYEVQSLGSFEFKNVEEPMEMFCLANEGFPIPKRAEMQGKLKSIPKDSKGNFFQRLWTNRIPQILFTYLLITWVALQFFDWALDQFGISPHWAQIFFITVIGIIPSLLVYLTNRERIGKGQLKLGEKVLFPTNIVLLGATLFFMFRTTDLGATSIDISLVDEDGIEVTETFIKKEFKKQIPIFQFDPIKEDSANAWLGFAIIDLLNDKLNNTKYLLPIRFSLPASRLKQGKRYTTVEKINLSKSWKGDFYIDGQYQVNGNEYEIIPTIRNKKTGKIIQRQHFKGEDFFSLFDSMHIYLCQAVGLTKRQIEASPDLNQAETNTYNIEAAKHFYLGASGLGNFYREMEKAIAIDSTYAYAFVNYAVLNNTYNHGKLEAKIAIDKAMKYRNRMPFTDQIATMVQKHMIYQEWGKAERLLKIQLEIDPSNGRYNSDLSNLYFITGQIEKLVKHTENHFAKSPNPSTEFQAMRALLINDEPNKVISRVKNYLLLDQQNVRALELLANAYIIKGDLDLAQSTLEDIIILKPDVELNINKSLEAIAYLKENPVNTEYLNKFKGFYRFSGSELIIELRIIANQIYSKATNQQGHFIFPTGASTFKGGHLGMAHNYKLLLNEQGEVYTLKSIQSYKEKEYTNMYWKQDSIIWKAETLLKEGNYKKAQIAYQTALEKNPEHFYLDQAKQHLDYLQSKSEAEVQQNFQKFVGQYGEIKIWIENDLLYYKRSGFARRIFRPISDNHFTTLLCYIFNYEFVEKNGKILGIQRYDYNHETKEWDKNENWYYERTELLD